VSSPRAVVRLEGMETINNTLEINAPVAKVREAITTTAGHKGWWTLDAEVGAKEARFAFPKGGDTMELTFRVDRMDDDGIVWTCIGGKNSPEWLDTKLAIKLAPKAGGTRVELAHSGWRAKTETYEMCTGGWSHFMNSLKAYVETGAGTPFGK
jgi:uncharacterized protein YndB with AHSA1/START domain